MKYSITLTSQQVGIISRALEVYARIGAGQVNLVSEAIQMDFQEGFSLDSEATQILRDHTDHLRSVVEKLRKSDGSASHRQHSAFYLHQCLRNRMAWDLDPSGGLSVTFDEPMAIMSEVRPRITTVAEDEKTKHVCSLTGGYNLCGAPFPSSAMDMGVVTKENITKITCLDCRYLANPSRRRTAF